MLRTRCPNLSPRRACNAAPEPHLDELAEGGVCGVVGDEEPHVLVGDLHRGRSVHASHRDNVWKKNTETQRFPTG